MAESGPFSGWGDIRTGCDVASTKVFAGALAYWPTLQAAGEIEIFQTVLLGSYGAIWAASSLLRGDPEKLGRPSMAPEFKRLVVRASAVGEGTGVVPANLDAGAVGWVGEANQATADQI